LGELFDLALERGELVARLREGRGEALVVVARALEGRTRLCQASFESVDVTGGRIEATSGQGELLGHQLELSLKLMHLSVVLSDPPLEFFR